MPKKSRCEKPLETMLYCFPKTPVIWVRQTANDKRITVHHPVHLGIVLLKHLRQTWTNAIILY